MELESLLKIIDKVSSSELTEFCYEEGNLKLNLKKEKTEVMVASVPETVPAAAPPKVGPAAKEEKPLEGNVVKAPLVGTFYNAPSPDAEPFVKVGDKVQKGQVLGIIEAMKLMNEIESDFDGEVKEILINNEEMVEYGQPMFLIG